MNKPIDMHWQAMKRILIYLAGILFHGLYITANLAKTITSYIDFDYARCVDDLSTSG